ncbi:28S ribosomal protein S7, mitochondrial [Trichonephila inaurata madagascariensis]|uniref:28S ribosomal protein S7, mitochondrial n=1 Tax=Trichonephila inaurata madagascariensis TaxID=2747483 RepID=A0A8X6YKD4_9ARAC|nr:28S ribosomal protein S7, mitochondrial [Trichonephila inaurata madagascariensis]
MACLSIIAGKQFKLCKLWMPLIGGVRNRLIPAWHLDPISSKEELARLEMEGELEKLKVMPVKPAPAHMTNSLHDDPVVNEFNNMVMQWGNRTLARQLVHDTFTRIKQIQLTKYHAASAEEKTSIELDPKKILIQAIENCKPVLSVTPIKKGGITYQVPVPIAAKKSTFMSMKWLVMAARDKEGPISFVEQLTKELLDAYNMEGRVVRRKQDLHKLCENNKAYAHYRWS